MNWRITFIFILTLGLLIGAFTLYRHFLGQEIVDSNEPNIGVDLDVQLTHGGPVDSDTTVTMNGAEFEVREQGKVTQVFGFKGKLDYQREKYWEIDQPYMKLFQPNMTILIDASFGQVEMESAAGNMVPKDATFSGNVCIHVVPTEHSQVEECWINMEKMVFVSERSEFSSSGAISFRSRSLEMQGRNLRFVYNDYEKKVQFFRLEQLDRMVIRVPETGLFFGDQEPVPTPGGSTLSVTASDKPEDLPKVLAAALAGQLYHCRLQRNVMLQTPKQAVYASDGVILTHILWPKGALQQWQTGPSDPNDPNAPRSPEATPVDANTPLTELTVTCDGGVTIIPAGMDWPEIKEDPAFDAQQARTQALAQLSEHQSWFAARRITHHVFQQHAIADGPVELTFYGPNLMDPNDSTVLVPVKVTAQDRAEYDPNDNDIVFTGDCRCTLVRTDPNTVERYSLTAERLTAFLARNKDEQAIAASRDVKRLLADGNDVVLRILTADPNRTGPDQSIAPEEVRVGAEMTCLRCEYLPEPGHEVFTARGPGRIRLNNSRGMKSTDPNQIKEPFYAFLRNFEVLQFFQAEYKIVADARERTMEFIYVPQVDGQLKPQITAQADHLEITLANNDLGELELKSLLATGNVYCRDAANNLSGYALSFDRDEGIVHMWGKDKQICYANGVAVSGIKLNLHSGELKFDVLGPSVLPLDR